MTPVEAIPVDQRDPDQVIRDAQQQVDAAMTAYIAAMENYQQLLQQYGRSIPTEPVRRWT